MALPCSIQIYKFVVVPGHSGGCRSEASATKDSVDALTCVSYLELRERKPTRCSFEMGSSYRSSRAQRWTEPAINVILLWISD